MGWVRTANVQRRFIERPRDFSDRRRNGAGALDGAALRGPRRPGVSRRQAGGAAEGDSRRDRAPRRRRGLCYLRRARLCGSRARRGNIDTLVNNAAGNFMARTEKLTPNAFHAVVGIVLYGSFNCTQVFGRRWILRKQPANVLNISTTYAAANCGSGYVVPSACAKAGVLAMTTSLAVEWAKYKIRVNAIAPGPFPTEGAWSRLMPSKQFEQRAVEKHPMKRFGRHEELTNLAAFLLSDMAEYINGECVVIDGGQWLRGAGEFNDLAVLPESTWEAMEAARKK